MIVGLRGVVVALCIFCMLPALIGGLFQVMVPPDRARHKTKVYANWPVLVLLGFSMFWTLCIFIAPMTMPPHTVENLDTGTNQIDFSGKWAKLNFFDDVVYYIGDSQCHQLSNRTYYINGNQMPVCARCMALFLFGNLGVVTAMLILPRYDISKAAMQLFPAKLRNYIQSRNKEFQAWIILCILCMLPTAIDGFTQILMPNVYESTNLKRIIFSLPTGWFGGLAMGLMINNIYYNIYDPELIGLPPVRPERHKAEKPKDDGPPDKGGKKKEGDEIKTGRKVRAEESTR
jgi:uncharacterized membrane protein